MNPFKSAIIIGENVDSQTYLRSKGERGERGYIMSRSELMEFARCPGRWIRGFSDNEETKSTEFGQVLDCLALTPEKFDSLFAVCPETYTNDKKEVKEWNFNANICKQWREGQGNKTIIKSGVRDSALRAAERLMEDEVASELINNSQKQVFIIAEYEDKETEITVPVKVLIDIVPHKTHRSFGKTLADFKTSVSADPGAWAKHVFNYDYHIQGALYLDAYIAATGEDRTDFLHLIQENYAPWEIGKRILSAEFLNIGRNAYLSALQLYCRCLHRNEWPGYDDRSDRTVINGCTLTEPEPWMILRIPDGMNYAEAV